MNNVLEVQEYVPENLASLSSFDPPPSPPERSASTCVLVVRLHSDAPHASDLTPDVLS